MRMSCLAVLLFSLAFLTSSAARAEGADPAPAPKLPDDVGALPKDLATRMKQLIHSAEDFRGLPCKHAVPCGSLGEDILRKKMVEAFHEELPPDKVSSLEATLKEFKFVPTTMNLGKYYPELLTSQVGGFYDPRRQYLVIVQRDGGLLGKEAKEKYGPELAQRMEETVIVHELTHAIQDQHFDLKKFASNDPLSDEGAARLALIEGDATLTMYNFFSNMKLENMPGIEEMMGQIMKNPQQLMDMSPDMPGAKEMASAPAYFRDNMLFSYLQGYVFCLNIKKLGGQRLLDYAFTKDPPRSTEQIMHPEKWHGKRDDPIVIELPDLSKTLEGWKKIGEGQLGEQSIGVLLREHLKDNEVAEKASAGWGGDKFAVYEKDGKFNLVWVTDWDTADDRKEFQDALTRDIKNGSGWQVLPGGDKRLVVLTNPKAVPGAAADALLAAKASVPENKAVDVATIGGKAKGGAGDQDLSDLLNDPNVKDMVKRLGGDEAGEGGMDIGKMMQDPAVQGMIKDMLKQERPVGKASEDGRTYTNDELGISIKAPASHKDWKLDAKPPIPMASVMISDPDKSVQVFIVNQKLPMAIPMELLAPQLEMAPKMSVQNYKKISSTAIKSGDVVGQEIQFEGVQAGQQIRSTLRVYVDGANMIMLNAVAPKDAFSKNEKTIQEVIDSFKFVEKKAGGGAPKKADPAEEPEPLKE